jgi:hypothetical protein
VIEADHATYVQGLKGLELDTVQKFLIKLEQHRDSGIQLNVEGALGILRSSRNRQAGHQATLEYIIRDFETDSGSSAQRNLYGMICYCYGLLKDIYFYWPR